MKWIVFVLLLFCIYSLSSQTIISAGNVSGTWNLAGSPYLIEGEIDILDGETLTIDPGCLVEFQGCLLAVGTEQDSIRLTAADTTDGGWHGTHLDDQLNKCVTWQGKDSENKSVSSSIYLYQLKVDGKVKKSKKMMLMK